MVLVVATVTKKEFITTALREFPLTTQEWVSTHTHDKWVLGINILPDLSLCHFFLPPLYLQHNICIVYHVSKKPWSKSEMCIYIDGELKKVAVMKAPNFTDVSFMPASQYILHFPYMVADIHLCLYWAWLVTAIPHPFSPADSTYYHSPRTSV